MTRIIAAMTGLSFAVAIGTPVQALGFEDIDLNGDGLLSEAEFYDMFTIARADAFGNVDVNGDGMVSFSEAMNVAPVRVMTTASAD